MTRQGLGRQGQEDFFQGPIFFTNLSINLVGFAKHFSLKGFTEASLDSLADKGASREASLLRHPVDPRKEGSR